MSKSAVDMLSPLLSAISGAGGNVKLAEGVNAVSDLPLPETTPKTDAHVSTWRRRGACPPDLAIRIEYASRGRVNRHQLRPDVFGTEPIPLAQPAEQLREAAE